MQLPRYDRVMAPVGCAHGAVILATALATLIGCARRQPDDTHTVPVAGTGMCIDIPTSLTAETKADDHGYVDVLVGEVGRDICVAGVEVYLAAAPNRPRDLASLRQSLERDHEARYKLTAGPEILQREGRATVTATLESTEGGLRQRQWAFLLGPDPVVISVYSTRAMSDCDPLEATILSSIRRGLCTDSRSR